jgi:hypothetical protein
MVRCLRIGMKMTGRCRCLRTVAAHTYHKLHSSSPNLPQHGNTYAVAKETAELASSMQVAVRFPYIAHSTRPAGTKSTALDSGLKLAQDGRLAECVIMTQRKVGTASTL